MPNWSNPFGCGSIEYPIIPKPFKSSRMGTHQKRINIAVEDTQ